MHRMDRASRTRCAPNTQNSQGNSDRNSSALQVEVRPRSIGETSARAALQRSPSSEGESRIAEHQRADALANALLRSARQMRGVQGCDSWRNSSALPVAVCARSHRETSARVALRRSCELVAPHDLVVPSELLTRASRLRPSSSPGSKAFEHLTREHAREFASLREPRAASQAALDSSPRPFRASRREAAGVAQQFTRSARRLRLRVSRAGSLRKRPASPSHPRLP